MKQTHEELRQRIENVAARREGGEPVPRKHVDGEMRINVRGNSPRGAGASYAGRLIGLSWERGIDSWDLEREYGSPGERMENAKEYRGKRELPGEGNRVKHIRSRSKLSWALEPGPNIPILSVNKRKCMSTELNDPPGLLKFNRWSVLRLSSMPLSPSIWPDPCPSQKQASSINRPVEMDRAVAIN